MPKGVIERAAQLYRKRNFSQVIRLLESQVFRFRENARFYRLLGCACLRTGDFGGAESYLRRADQLRSEDPEVLLGLAAVHLKRGESDKALSLWLRVLDLQPRNATALRGLELLRAASATERYPDLHDTKSLARLLPPLPVRSWTIVLPVIILAVAGAAALGYFLGFPQLIHREPGSRPGVAEIELTDTRPSIALEPENPTYTMTEQQVERAFELAKKHLLDYRDNLAIREINRILLSNASVYVKEKARLLKTFVAAPDFTTIKDPFPFAEVREDPLLHRDGFVVWRGKIANVRVGEEEIRFDLLVGYEDERELEGVVPVSLGFASALEDGQALEVLGQVVVTDSSIALRGISLHRLYRMP
ncbi:MAG: tetratricopeptide repeat protein [Spirochaetales bacterium]|nr:tetratricopeptide repeat protein [Spirochaetales bacterium]